MKRSVLLALSCAAVFATAAQSFGADSATRGAVTRMKAKLVSFDGAVLTLQPATGASFSVSVLPDTRYVGSDRAPFAGIKAGDYAGAAVEPRGAALRATDVYLYAPQLRGTGEGRFPDGGRLMVNGTVTAVAPATPKDGVLTLHYHGAVLNQAGKGATVCEGRATPAPYASAMACEADAVIAVAPGTPVSALTVGDKSLLVPGATVTVAMTRLPDGKSVTPGVVVEKPQSPQ